MEARAALRISRSAQFPLVTVGASITPDRESLQSRAGRPDRAGQLFGLPRFRRRCFL